MKRLTLFFIIVAAIFGCRGRADERPMRSAYYWRTAFSLDSAQLRFIAEHDIRRIYLRYFDVVLESDGQTVPRATLRLLSQMPTGVETVPTVFVENECLRGDVEALARRIVGRVAQMSETNDIGGVREMQIDCDWTERTRAAFHRFLAEARRAAKERGMGLSTTIRLHQLSEQPPPADRGVLMMYNTGDFTRANGRNPVLDMRDAGPYLKHLADYRLPLSTAYPVYRWRLIYRGGHFLSVYRDDDTWAMVPGDSLADCEVPLQTILDAKQAIDDRLPSANNEIIIFDLSNDNINRLTRHEYETIFTR